MQHSPEVLASFSVELIELVRLRLGSEGGNLRITQIEISGLAQRSLDGLAGSKIVVLRSPTRLIGVVRISAYGFMTMKSASKRKGFFKS